MTLASAGHQQLTAHRPTGPPSRLLVIGCGGSGKSTVARRLAAITGLPVIHLDSHFWRPNWQQVGSTEWERVVDDLLQRPRWIMDGNYGGTMMRRIAACDGVVFLDFPMWTCLWRVMKRRVLFAGKIRPDMGAGCRERLTWEFVRYILAYRRTRRPKILERLAAVQHEKDVVILTNDRAVENYLQAHARRYEP